MFDLVRIIKFKKFSNAFQRKLKEDRIRINNENSVIVPADKSSNYYRVDKGDYDNLLSKEVHKFYRKATDEEIRKITDEHTNLVTELDIDDRVFKTSKSKARITLKDHKSDFRNNPKTRLINSCKPEIGKISKKSIKRIIDELKIKTGFAQWKNSYDVIRWFKDIKNKKNCSFFVLDICEYYPSITRKLLNDALNWAAGLV